MCSLLKTYALYDTISLKVSTDVAIFQNKPLILILLLLKHQIYYSGTVDSLRVMQTQASTVK